MLRRLLALILFVSLPGSGGSAFSSDCIIVHPLDLYDAAVVVFSGVVDSIEEHPYGNDNDPLSGLIEYTFHTARVWKGPLHESFTVTILSGGFPLSFRLGKHYLVYATVLPAADVLWTNTCWRPQPIERAIWDLAALREPFVVDANLQVARPTNLELEQHAAGSDERLAFEARCALGREQVRRRNQE